MAWILILFFSALLINIIIYSRLYGITPTPTSWKVQRELLKVLPSIEKGIIVELGSGWGTLALALARHYPHCEVIAYEISPIPYFVSKIIASYYSLPNLTILRKDFFSASFQSISLAVCYLYPQAMEKIKSKFEKECKKNAYLLSHTFAIPGWKALRIEYANDIYHTPIYLYRIK